MSKTLLMAAAAAALALIAGRAGAVAPDPVKIRATYERLCTGDGPGSLAVCEALRRDMEDAGTPGTKGFSGMMVGASDDGVKAAYVYGVAPGSPAAAAGLRTGDRLIEVDGTPVTDGAGVVAAFGPAGAGRKVSVKFLRGSSVNEVALKLAEAPTLKPILNAQRTNRGAYSLWSGSALTVDKVQVAETFQGILEDSDASHDWGWREDCVEIAAPAGRPLAVFFTPNGQDMTVSVQNGQCGPGLGTTRWGNFPDGKKTSSFSFEAAPAGQRTYLYISGHSSSKPYELVVREQTPKETIAYREDVRQRQIAAQQRAEEERRAEAQRAEERSAFFSAALSGIAAGLTNTPLPAMREDGSAPNVLDVLNAANAKLARENAEGAARLNATIAQAQQQAQRQRQETAQREAAESQARQQAKIEHDRQTLTTVLGNSRSFYEQKAQEAAAKGDTQNQKFYADRARGVQESAQRVGVGNDVQQYAQNKRVAGQGQLGQTPIGPLPAPTVTSSAPRPVSPEPQQRTGRAELCTSYVQEVRLDFPLCGSASRKTSASSSGSGNGGSPGSSTTVRTGGSNPPSPGMPGGGGGGGVGIGGGVGQNPAPQYDIRPEAVTLCELVGNRAKFNQWTCHGPLQINYVIFDKPNWQTELGFACGSNNFRDLGMTGGYKAFGCGFAASPDPQSYNALDIPAKLGVSYVPGRARFRCPKGSDRCQRM